MDRFDELMQAAARMWTAAESLDAFHGGGDAAWRWTHRQVARLEREGRTQDPEAVREVAQVLEKPLERDRREVEA